MTCTAKNNLSRLSPSGSFAGKDMVFDRMRDFEFPQCTKKKKETHKKGEKTCWV